jgi:2-methylcitrate dehydratase PrpD
VAHARELADWALGLTLERVPASARDAALRHLLDGVGNAIGSARTGAVEPAVAVAVGLGGPAEATILGSGSTVSAPAAALANGALVHGLDFDDTHAGGLVHATAVVLPAAFAVGEQVGASGQQVLTAAIAGYEAVCRIAMASPHGFHARGLHATHVAGTLAAALISARLMQLDTEQTTNALGIAGSASGGLLEFLNTGASTKQLHPGTASLNGVLAARLAAAGATGPDSVLEGQYGVYAALSARPADVASVTDGLGQRWEVEQITVKPYPACQLMHVTLDAVSAAVAAEGVTAADVAAITADVHPDSASIVCEPADVKLQPRSAYDAKFSLPWSVAALLIDGQVGVETYEPASIARPEVAELAKRVHSRITKADGVAADAAGNVVIELADGRKLTGAVSRSAGGPQTPLSDDALAAKFLANCGGGQAAAGLLESVRSLTDAKDLSSVMTAAKAAANLEGAS